VRSPRVRRTQRLDNLVVASDELGRNQSVADTYSHPESDSHAAGRIRAPVTGGQLGIDDGNRRCH
jgi:hypothetical protein